MFKKTLCFTALALFLPSVSLAKTKASVICSSSAPRIEGFELVRVGAKKERAEGAYTVRSRTYSEGGILYRGSFDVPARRLKLSAVQVDEDGEEGLVLVEADAVLIQGEHLRVKFLSPVEPVELYCHVIFSES